jgi:hypothetical protein
MSDRSINLHRIRRPAAVSALILLGLLACGTSIASETEHRVLLMSVTMVPASSTGPHLPDADAKQLDDLLKEGWQVKDIMSSGMKDASVRLVLVTLERPKQSPVLTGTAGEGGIYVGAAR